MEIKKIIIWGNKLHTHTHSYIHGAFFKAFKHLGYETYWFDDNNFPNDFDFENSFFLSHSDYLKKMPINNSSFYFLHNVEKKYHEKIPIERKLFFQVYTTDCIGRDTPNIERPFHYFTQSADQNIIYFPWASDLLPEEIEENIKNLEHIKTSKNIYFVGSRTDAWDKFSRICRKNRIRFLKREGISFEENKKLIQESIISPAIQFKWQIEKEYIPCRIFKNISYGKMGITNSEGVQRLFNGKLIYDSDLNNILKKGLEFEKREDKNKIIEDLMSEVKEKHTYLNRIEYIKWYMEKYMNITM